jgi:hypothetical protein
MALNMSMNVLDSDAIETPLDKPEVGAAHSRSRADYGLTKSWALGRASRARVIPRQNCQFQGRQWQPGDGSEPLLQNALSVTDGSVPLGTMLLSSPPPVYGCTAVSHSARLLQAVIV